MDNSKNYENNNKKMGSNYFTKEGSSSDSMNNDGLRFGKKIYFEDVGIGVNGKTGNRSKRNGNNGQPPRCQVEGCNVDLTDAKSYYSRHKVCGMHSKSPLVVVSGLQQRFCQQCSRFHQLPEFDQGKRSCRRRLAGHNERRRKPPSGSLLSSRLGRLSSSLFGDSTTKSEILLDFSLYSRHAGSDLWPGSKISETVAGNQSASLEKFHHNPWPGDPENPPSKMYQQGSVGSAGESSFTIPLGECVTGVSTDSTCALSLLSNQTWGSRNRSSGTDLGNLVNLGGASMCQSTSTQTVTISHSPISNPSWNFKGNNGNEANMGFNGASSDHLGLAQFSHGFDSQLHGDLLMDHQAHGYGSAATASQVHWSL